jgi:hypothetical protein
MLQNDQSSICVWCCLLWFINFIFYIICKQNDVQWWFKVIFLFCTVFDVYRNTYCNEYFVGLSQVTPIKISRAFEVFISCCILELRVRCYFSTVIPNDQQQLCLFYCIFAWYVLEVKYSNNRRFVGNNSFGRSGVISPIMNTEKIYLLE